MRVEPLISHAKTRGTTGVPQGATLSLASAYNTCMFVLTAHTPANANCLAACLPCVSTPLIQHISTYKYDYKILFLTRTCSPCGVCCAL